jgi:hypothetical protein
MATTISLRTGFEKLEAFVLLAAALVLYAHVGGGWGRFALLFLAPDLSFAAWLAGPRAGAVVYDLVHNLGGPIALALASLAMPSLLPLSLIWLAHIAADRVLGYGLR